MQNSFFFNVSQSRRVYPLILALVQLFRHERKRTSIPFCHHKGNLCLIDASPAVFAQTFSRSSDIIITNRRLKKTALYIKIQILHFSIGLERYLNIGTTWGHSSSLTNIFCKNTFNVIVMGTDSTAQIDVAGRMKTTVPAFVPVTDFIFPQERKTETFIYKILRFQCDAMGKVKKCSF